MKRHRILDRLRGSHAGDEDEDYKNEVILIARRLLTPIGGSGTPMGRNVQRMAIEVCKARGWS
jgi:hypothetical protein